MQTSKVLLGTLAGIAIGAVVGVLLAPDKGSETRKKLSRKGAEYRDGLKNTIEGAKDKYNDVVDNVTSKLESLSSRADEVARQGKNSISDMKTAANTTTANTTTR